MNSCALKYEYDWTMRRSGGEVWVYHMMCDSSLLPCVVGLDTTWTSFLVEPLFFIIRIPHIYIYISGYSVPQSCIPWRMKVVILQLFFYLWVNLSISKKSFKTDVQREWSVFKRLYKKCYLSFYSFPSRAFIPTKNVRLRHWYSWKCMHQIITPLITSPA